MIASFRFVNFPKLCQGWILFLVLFLMWLLAPRRETIRGKGGDLRWHPLETSSVYHLNISNFVVLKKITILKCWFDVVRNFVWKIVRRAPPPPFSKTLPAPWNSVFGPWLLGIEARNLISSVGHKHILTRCFQTLMEETIL